MARSNVAKSAANVNGLQLIRVKGIQRCLATYKGETKTLSEWAKQLGTDRNRLYQRIVIMRLKSRC